MALPPRRRWQPPSATTERTPRGGLITSLVLHAVVFGGLALWFSLPAAPPDEPLIPTPQGLMLSPISCLIEPAQPSVTPPVEVPADTTTATDSTELPTDTAIEVPPFEPVRDTRAVVISDAAPSTAIARFVTASRRSHGPAPSSVINTALGTSPSSLPVPATAAPGIAWNPTFISGKDPIYPRSARRQHQQGSVRLQLCIEWTGAVLSVCVLRSSGSSDLDDAAVSAALAWQFSPRPPQNIETRKQVELEVVFRLVSTQTTHSLQLASQ